MKPLPIGRPYRIAIAWQSVAVAAIAMVAGLAVGRNGLLSAFIGGGIGILGVILFALVSSRRASSAVGAIRVAFRAEATKIIAVVILLWLSFATYRDLAVLPFIGAFMVSVLLSAVAFAVPDKSS
jgi:F0F1-type ATP synthase assembly protein I